MRDTLPEDDAADDPGATVDHLYAVLGPGGGGGARWSLDGLDAVEVGRGDALTWRIDGAVLTITCPDRWMSSRHLRLEREHGRWYAADAGARNGVLVNGLRQARAVVVDDDLIEAGRSLLALRRGEPAGAAALVVDPRASAPLLATLDPYLAQRFDELTRIAATRAPVVIHGATGTGKERVAQAVHALSRRPGPLVAVNCGALPAGLVEAELFGHKRGAFSGAVADRPGLVASANRGTLFLDELGDLPLPAQAALLRVLEGQAVRPVGGAAEQPVNLRVVVATHRNLDAMVAAGSFRDDLLARLRGFTLTLPALAERRVDLGVMVATLVPPGTVLAAATARALWAYAWPRNVRELARVLERAVGLAGDDEVKPAHLPPEVAAASLAVAVGDDNPRRAELERLLALHHGNVSRVAAELGHVRQQVQRWLKRYGLEPERFR